MKSYSLTQIGDVVVFSAKTEIVGCPGSWMILQKKKYISKDCHRVKCMLHQCAMGPLKRLGPAWEDGGRNLELVANMHPCHVS